MKQIRGRKTNTCMQLRMTRLLFTCRLNTISSLGYCCIEARYCFLLDLCRRARCLQPVLHQCVHNASHHGNRRCVLAHLLQEATLRWHDVLRCQSRTMSSRRDPAIPASKCRDFTFPSCSLMCNATMATQEIMQYVPADGNITSCHVHATSSGILPWFCHEKLKMSNLHIVITPM
jgi:hypothetical protein